MALTRLQYLKSARTMYRGLWNRGNNHINTLLQDVPNSDLKYLPAATLTTWGSQNFSYSEEALLVRTTYNDVVEKLQTIKTEQNGCHGVMVTGQPGIG